MSGFNDFLKKSFQKLKKKLATGSCSLQSMQTAYQKEFQLRKKIFNQLQELRGNIRVFVRVRPLLKNEVMSGTPNAVTCRHEDTVILRSTQTHGMTKKGKPRAIPESQWELD